MHTYPSPKTYCVMYTSCDGGGVYDDTWSELEPAMRFALAHAAAADAAPYASVSATYRYYVQRRYDNAPSRGWETVWRSTRARRGDES